MKTILILLPILFALNLHAEKAKPLVLPKPVKENPVDERKVSYDMTCETGGHSVKSEDPGFETCMAGTHSTTYRQKESKKAGK